MPNTWPVWSTTYPVTGAALFEPFERDDLRQRPDLRAGTERERGVGLVQGSFARVFAAQKEGGRAAIGPERGGRRPPDSRSPGISTGRRPARAVEREMVGKVTSIGFGPGAGGCELRWWERKGTATLKT
ncbi:hypothetical protein GCM10017771_71330 [Streptomyces capitiformicae]|uniref:Uncharacterized protein n=1 Tax=Streptomyces capitiformicae TaxID=2014920 RepID=A0A919DJ23_9ACTN|nr:hypothetical protein GCM10017771_71330 [Streptomyces capitiformicae]